MFFENIRSRQRERVAQGGTRTVTRVFTSSFSQYEYICMHMGKISVFKEQQLINAKLMISEILSDWYL